MRTVKTAISMQEPLFREANALAREMKLPRSRIFVMAMEDFLQRRRNARMLEKLNEVYADEPDADEREYLRRMKAKHVKMVRGQW